MEFNIKLIEKTEVISSIPNIDYKSMVSMPATIFGKVLSNVQPISDIITIENSQSGLRFLADGDIGDAIIDIENDKNEIKTILKDNDAVASYSLEYMVKIVRAIGREAKKLDFEYASKSPIHVKFEMPSLTKVEYYLAPRIEN